MDNIVVNWTFVVAFIAILLAASVFGLRRVKNYTDYNLAGRKTRLFPLVATLGAAEFNTATLIGGAGVAYTYGAVGMWYTALIFLVVFGFYALTVAKRYRRLQIKTIAEFFDHRFGGRCREPLRILVTLITATNAWLLPATYVAGLALIGEILLGVSALAMAIGVTLLAIIISVGGGLFSAIAADVVAFVMFVVGLPIVFVIGWQSAGGFGALQTVYEPRLLSLEPIWDLPSYGFGVVLTWGLSVTMSYIASPWYGQRIFSARDERTAVRAMAINTFSVTALYALAVGATMFARVALPPVSEPETALPRLIRDFAPPVLQGFLLVTLLLVGTSTIVAMMNAGANIATNDFVRRYLVKNASDRVYTNVGRICLLLIGTLTIFFARTFIGNILLAVLYISVYLVQLAVPILAGFYWRRFNTISALAGLVSGCIYVTIALSLDLREELIAPVGLLINIVVAIGAALIMPRATDVGTKNSFFKEAGEPLG